MTARFRTFPIDAACVSAVCVTALCGVGCAKPKPQQHPPVPVTVAGVETRDVPYLIAVNGVVEPMQTVAIASQVGGTLDRVEFREGDDVRAGHPLFQIDPRPFQAALEQARATLARDEAQAHSAKRDAERYEALVQKDYVTRSQADQAAATAAAAAATVEADRAAVEKARLDLANTIIRAPISGRTGGLLVKQGNLVRANSAPPLVVINQIHPILVRFSLPQAQLPELQHYYGAGRPLDVIVTPSEGSGTAVHGTLSFVDNAVDSTTGTVLLKARFDNAAGTLWPGQFVAVRLQLYVQRHVMTVPSQAVLTGQQGSYVFTVDGTGKARQRPVVTGVSVDSLVVVESGVARGDRVIVDGQSRLTPGAKVVVKGGREGPASGGPSS